MAAKNYFLLFTIVIAQIWLSDAQSLTIDMLVNAQVDQVRPILQDKIEPARLNKYLNSLGKMVISGSDLALEGHFELLSTILAANSPTSEADWFRIANGDRTLLTQQERNEIPADTRRSHVLRIIFPNRLPRDLATLLVNIMNTLHRTTSQEDRNAALHAYFVQTLIVASGRPKAEVETWFSGTFNPNWVKSNVGGIL